MRRAAVRAVASGFAALALCAASAPAQMTTSAQHSGASAHSGNRLISGVVISGASSQPLEGVDVVLRQDGSFETWAETTTDAQGSFLFTDLPDGRFSLVASRRGFVASAYQEHGGVSTAIVTGENLITAGFVIALAPLASIFGTVTEDSGDPVPQARVNVFRDDPMRAGGRQRAAVASADAMGNFEIAHLAPGNYYLCASGAPWYRPTNQNASNEVNQPRSPLDVAYPLECYPDTADPAGAEPITVNAGDHIETDLTLHAVPALHITFQVPGPGVAMPTLRQNVFGTTDYVAAGVSFVPGRQNNPDSGTMTVVLSGVAPGQYEFQVQSAAPEGRAARFGSVQLSSSDLTVDASTLPAVSGVSGKVVLAGGGALPAGATLSLNSQASGAASSSPIRSDGSFHLGAAAPGSYEISVSTPGAELVVTHLKINGTTSNGSLLTLGSDNVDVVVTATAPIANVSGSVQRSGKAASGVFVLLVPANAGDGGVAPLPNQSDSDGSFVFEHVPAGRYTAIAIEQGWTLDWSLPQVLAPFLARGIAVTVAPGARHAEIAGRLEAQALLAHSLQTPPTK
jgi:Carboxypeptidase regulatory-like domain